MFLLTLKYATDKLPRDTILFHQFPTAQSFLNANPSMRKDFKDVHNIALMFFAPAREAMKIDWCYVGEMKSCRGKAKIILELQTIGPSDLKD